MVVEGSAVVINPSAVDRLMTGLVWSSFGIAVLPLIWLIYVVVREGLQAISMEPEPQQGSQTLSPTCGRTSLAISREREGGVKDCPPHFPLSVAA